MFDATIEIDMKERDIKAKQQDDRSYDEFLAGLYTASGYPNIHEIASLVWSSPKVVWAFTMPFKALSPSYSKGIAFVMHKTLDYSAFRVRMWVSVFYAVGFVLLLKPTAETFMRIIWNAVS